MSKNINFVSPNETLINKSIFIVFSEYSLNKIRDTIEKYKNLLENEVSNEDTINIGPIKIDFFHGKETSRTVIVMDHRIYQKMVEFGLNKKNGNNFYIVPFKLSKHNYPPLVSTDDLKKIASKPYDSLFIKIPVILNLDSAREILVQKMKELASFDIIPYDSFKIKIPYNTRENNGKHSGICYINFTEITLEQVTYVKFLLHLSKWLSINNDKSDLRLECFWTKNIQEKTKKPSYLEILTKKD